MLTGVQLSQEQSSGRSWEGSCSPTVSPRPPFTSLLDLGLHTASSFCLGHSGHQGFLFSKVVSLSLTYSRMSEQDFFT